MHQNQGNQVKLVQVYRDRFMTMLTNVVYKWSIDQFRNVLICQLSFTIVQLTLIRTQTDKRFSICGAKYHVSVLLLKVFREIRIYFNIANFQKFIK